MPRTSIWSTRTHRHPKRMIKLSTWKSWTMGIRPLTFHRIECAQCLKSTSQWHCNTQNSRNCCSMPTQTWSQTPKSLRLSWRMVPGSPLKPMEMSRRDMRALIIATASCRSAIHLMNTIWSHRQFTHQAAKLSNNTNPMPICKNLTTLFQIQSSLSRTHRRKARAKPIHPWSAPRHWLSRVCLPRNLPPQP